MAKSENNMNKNLTMSVMFMSGANFVTFFILLWVYKVTNEIWFLIAGIAMLIAGVLFMIIVSKFKTKLRKLEELKKTRQSEPNEPN
jgi:F0F1-type ATP synthase assembly protein I